VIPEVASPSEVEVAPSERVVVVAAVERELLPLRDLLRRAPRGDEVHLRVTGVGKVSSALETARAVRELRPSRVIQLGCAGSFPSRDVSVGDVVIATEEILGDEGVETPEGFLTLEELGLPSASRGATAVYNRVPTAAPSAALVEALRRRFPDDFKLVTGPLVTVSSASGTDDRARLLESRWQPVAESMEGAAAAVACWMEGLPFHEIRGVSNRAGKRDRASWDVDTACSNAARVTLALLELLRPPCKP